MDDSPAAIPFFRTPALSPDGSLVTFVYAADIWLAPTTGGEAERLTAHPAGHAGPHFSPDGNSIAFTSSRTGAGDLYVLPIAGGEVRRVTFHDATSFPEDWSPDGTQIYFSSHREQQGGGLFRIPTAGGTPVELAAEPYENLMDLSVSPDGATLAFNNVRDAWWRRGPNPFGASEIWLMPAWPPASVPGEPAPMRRLSTYAGMNRWPLWHPDGTGLYFVSDRDGAENIWFQALEGELRQITHFRDGRLLFPAIARNAGTIAFERNFGLWLLDPASGDVAPIPVSVRSDTRYTPVRTEAHTRAAELRLAPDGKKIAFVARGEVFADFADKETDREQRQGPAFRITSTPAREQQLAWHPDSRRLLYLSDRHGEQELYLYDFGRRSEARLSSDMRPKTQPRISPDGKWAAYICDTSEIVLLNLETSTARRFATGTFASAAAPAWSPDSRWLAFFSEDDEFCANVYVQRIDEETAHQVTFLGNIGGDTLHWSPNGRFLIFTSGQYREEHQIARVDLRPVAPLFRESEFEKLFEDRQKQPEERPKSSDAPPPAEPPVQPKDDAGQELAQPSQEKIDPQEAPPPAPAPPKAEPAPAEPAPPRPASKADVEIVFEGIERRLRLLTPPQMDAVAQAISPDSRDLLFVASVADKTNLWSLALDEPRHDQPPRQLTYTTTYKRDVQFSPDGKLFYYLDDGQVIHRKFPSGSEAVTLSLRADVTIDFQQEKRQIFGEAWRALRDTFYDETFRGNDWAALRAAFAPAVEGAQTSGDFHTVMRLMLGELRSSHLGVGGWGGGGHDGYTGIRLDPQALAGPGLFLVRTVVPDSPAALAVDLGGTLAPVRPGEYLLAVNGAPLGPNSNLDALLQRSVGRRVLLRLAADAAGNEAREVALRPVDAGRYDRLRYREWVVDNKEYVRRISNGRLGYVHIPAMSYPAYQQFLIDLDTAARSAEGVLVDVRFNGGGHTATFILDVLSRPSLLHSSFRGRGRADNGHLAGNRVLARPTALLTNERSASNAEILSESYRRMGLGPVVGRPTAGAVIWTRSTRLLDGSALQLPRIRVSTPEGEDLEGTGRPVDIDVEQPLGSRARGYDAQLEAAAHALLERIDQSRGS